MSKKAKTSIKKLKNFQKNFSHESKTKISINVVILCNTFLKSRPPVEPVACTAPIRG